MTQSHFMNFLQFWKDVNQVDTFSIQIDITQDIGINGVCSVKLI